MAKKTRKLPRLPIFAGIITIITLASGYYGLNSFRRFKSFEQYTQNIEAEIRNIKKQLQNTSNELEALKNEDQYQINQELTGEVENIKKTYSASVTSYEELLKLKDSTDNTEKLDELFTEALALLAKQNYTSATATLSKLNSQIQAERATIAASFTIPANVPENNAPPGAGYSQQKVSTDAGMFLVNLVAADIGSTRVVVDTASDGTCSNDCPVLPLATYVSRNGAFAGVNGSYFCPATYPSCAGKTNTFDTLLMNKNKAYFNSDNNVYSNNPAVIFGSGYIRFVTAASQWGRDTGIDSMISNFPLLVFNNQTVFGGDDDPKKGSKGNRSFVANKGNTIYIGVVRSVTVAESARVMSALGMDNALNLDNGGSTALWYGGYKLGPGRNLPNVILFVRK